MDKKINTYTETSICLDFWFNARFHLKWQSALHLLMFRCIYLVRELGNHVNLEVTKSWVQFLRNQANAFDKVRIIMRRRFLECQITILIVFHIPCHADLL